ncbi:TSUP family transporter [Brevundimonas sp. TWP2-3-4b1]|uniref:TSUP family transporter n=1 Tax=Brevundimonas sp. TWP2-3-4b1 TaxID=2804580 RepID=UPI003CF44E31
MIFAVAMAAVGLSMLRPKAIVVRPEPRLTWAMSPRIGLAGAGVGSAAGFFGIGGGFLIMPGLMASTGMSLATAQATSLLSVAAFGATTAGNYALSGWVDPGLVAAMTVGGVVGTLAGLPLARRLGANAALGRTLFAGLILIVAVYVGVRAIAVL